MNDTFPHLTEEMGELTWYARRPESASGEKVEDELGDVLFLVLHASNALKLDAESAWLKKTEKDEKKISSQKSDVTDPT